MSRSRSEYAKASFKSKAHIVVSPHSTDQYSITASSLNEAFPRREKFCVRRKQFSGKQGGRPIRNDSNQTLPVCGVWCPTSRIRRGISISLYHMFGIGCIGSVYNVSFRRIFPQRDHVSPTQPSTPTSTRNNPSMSILVIHKLFSLQQRIMIKLPRILTLTGNNKTFSAPIPQSQRSPTNKFRSFLNGQPYSHGTPRFVPAEKFFIPPI